MAYANRIRGPDRFKGNSAVQAANPAFCGCPISMRHPHQPASTKTELSDHPGQAALCLCIFVRAASVSASCHCFQHFGRDRVTGRPSGGKVPEFPEHIVRHPLSFVALASRYMRRKEAVRRSQNSRQAVRADRRAGNSFRRNSSRRLLFLQCGNGFGLFAIPVRRVDISAPFDPVEPGAFCRGDHLRRRKRTEGHRYKSRSKQHRFFFSFCSEDVFPGCHSAAADDPRTIHLTVSLYHEDAGKAIAFCAFSGRGAGGRNCKEQRRTIPTSSRPL